MTFLATYILPFVVLLGILVFVHEAGHFLVAKYFKIVVEKFSIGFGPRIFGATVGGTEYRVSWIPLGGYVKMAGDDPTDDESASVPGSFLGAKLWKRMLVVLAGPAVNLILPVFVFAVVFMIGKPVAAPYVGAVSSNTPAARAGLQAGDEVVSVNGEQIGRWDQMTSRIRASTEPVQLVVRRDGKELPFTIAPEIREQENDFGVKTKMPVIGIVQAGLAPVVDPRAGSPADAAGFRTGDRVVEVAGTALRYQAEFPALIAALPAGSASMIVERYGVLPTDPEARAEALRKPEKVTLTVAVAEANPTLESLGLGSADLVVSQIEADSPAEKAGLQQGDRLVAAGGTPINGAFDFDQWRRAQKPTAKTTISVLRDGATVDVPIVPASKSHKITGTSRSEEEIWLGVVTFAAFAPGKRNVERYSNPLRALWAGAKGTGEVISMNLQAFGMMFSGKIGVRDSLGGPIAIADVTGTAYKEAGIYGFVQVLIHMSVILGIMNLLPIPVLDGGHLAFFAIEAVMRRPPSIRVREVAQQAGLLLLLAVMAFVLVNDVVTRI